MKRKRKNKPATEIAVKAGRKARTIQIDYLARVEGEASLFIQSEKDKITDLRLKIFEPPRFFEALLRGRSAAETPDITSRICGICPVAYMMSSIHAIEKAFAVEISPSTRLLRRLLYCGEWIESHTLHIIMLHAPDFLGYPDAISMAKDHRDAVQRGLQLKKAGNEILRLLGGREIHPINVKVGGFYAIPSRAQFEDLRTRLVWARKAAEETLRWAATFQFPQFEGAYEFVALRHSNEYPMNEGRLVSSGGLDIDISEFEKHFQEFQVPYSNALHSKLHAKHDYLVGPLARYNLNFDRFPESIRKLAREIELPTPCRNPFQLILVRALEVCFACDEAIRVTESLCEALREARTDISPSAAVVPRQSVGIAATEAPRGLLYHRYDLAPDGTIREGKIVPPTSQNQSTIEADLRKAATEWSHLSKQELTARCERIIRNHDPCISCSAHFLKVEIQDG